jgi:hypothetical protein
VADVQPSQIRIGDTERQSALTALGDHMSAGRLDIDEYGDRTAQVATAKTRGELLALFNDLPAPHPGFGMAPRPAPQAPQPAPPMPASRPVPMRARLAAVSIPTALLAGIVLAIVLHTGLFLLLPVAMMVFGGTIWGDDWKHQRRMARDRYRQDRRDMHRHNRW